jgi:hypothetical protein
MATRWGRQSKLARSLIFFFRENAPAGFRTVVSRRLNDLLAIRARAG